MPTLARSLGLAAVASIVAMAGPALAQSWPTKPITFLNPFPAGGGTDVYARPLGAQLDKQLGVRFIIDNRAGAGGTVGAAVAAKMPPDGHSFFIGATHHTIAPSIYPKLEYDLEKDFIPVGLIARPPQIVVVHPKVEAKTLAELIAYARKNPDKLNYGSAGNGTAHHLAGELFQILTKTMMTHVPFRGAGPLMQDLIAGHVDLAFDGLGTSAAQIAGGRLRPLAVASAQRSPTVPEVPTAAEAGLANYEVSTWYAMWAPKGTPGPIVERMAQELKTALEQPSIKETWIKNGSDVTIMLRAEFGAYVRSETERWAKVVKEAGVKLE
jgi:tripartite-type tricarboxylate transporter receptor subunit TctC